MPKIRMTTAKIRRNKMSQANHITPKESSSKNDLNSINTKSECLRLKEHNCVSLVGKTKIESKTPEEVALEAHRITAWAKR
jgi:hypothetical protein